MHERADSVHTTPKKPDGDGEQAASAQGHVRRQILTRLDRSLRSDLSTQSMPVTPPCSKATLEIDRSRANSRPYTHYTQQRTPRDRSLQSELSTPHLLSATHAATKPPSLRTVPDHW